jgi:hypothetical protein
MRIFTTLAIIALVAAGLGGCMTWFHHQQAVATQPLK